MNQALSTAPPYLVPGGTSTSRDERPRLQLASWAPRIAEERPF